MKGLTDKQRQMLDFIAVFMRREGMAPTVYEIADQFGIRAATAFAHLRALQRKGAIKRSSKARSLALTGPARRPGPATPAVSAAAADPNPFLSVPMLGRIAAGAPMPAEEQAGEILRFDPSLLPRGAARQKLFALRVTGESMRDLGILDGDLVLARQTTEARSGDLVVALVGGTETTVKTLVLHPRGVVELRPANPDYPPQRYPAGGVSIRRLSSGRSRKQTCCSASTRLATRS